MIGGDLIRRGGKALAAGDAAGAIPLLREALRLAPRDPHGWRLLGDALLASGKIVEAGEAYLRQVSTVVGDPVVREAARALQANRLDQAERLLRAILRDRPTEVAAIRMLAELAIRIDRLADAERLLDRALQLAPGFAAARHNRAVVRHRRGAGAAALADIDFLLAQEADHPGYLATRAAILSRTGAYEEAIKTYDALLVQAGPASDARLWLSRGHALKTVGRRDACIASYREAVSIAPTLGEAWWSLANLKTYRFEAAAIAAMETAVADPRATRDDRMHLHFALGQACEQRGGAAAAFAHYREANSLRRAAQPYDSAAITAHVEGLRGNFRGAWLADRKGSGHLASDPIFIVGLPRSGSTLVEQILATHPAVEGTMELAEMITIAGELAERDGSYAGKLDRLPDADLAALGERYLAETRVHRRGATPLFIDKMPNNWMHVPLIHLILPNATIIDARRHPLDCGMSCFAQHFARGQAFTYDLADLGRYYADYVALMDHVDAMLPGRVHRVYHERLVADPETEIRALLAACNLPFDTACLDFHRTARPVRTASAEQVREPLSARGIGRWRKFDAWLGPLKEALGGIVEAYPA